MWYWNWESKLVTESSPSQNGANHEIYLLWKSQKIKKNKLFAFFQGIIKYFELILLINKLQNSYATLKKITKYFTYSNLDYLIMLCSYIW